MTYTTHSRGKAYARIDNGVLYVPDAAQIFFDPVQEYFIRKNVVDGHKHLSIFRREDFDREMALQFRAVARIVEGLEVRVSKGKVSEVVVPSSFIGYLGNPRTVILTCLREKTPEVWIPEGLEMYERKHMEELPELMEAFSRQGV